MPRFAANLTTMYSELPFLERFAAAAQDGFTAVEYLFPYEFLASELAEHLGRNGLNQVLFNAPPGNWGAGERGLAILPGREAEFREDFRRALEYADVLASPCIHVMAGIMPADVDPTCLHETYLRNLSWAAELARPLGRAVLIEPINLRDMPGYFLTYQEQAHEIVRQVANSHLKVQMDLYHCQIMEGDLTVKLHRYLNSTSSNVGHIQIAGVPNRHEPDTGELDCNYLFSLLDELGYKNRIGCEYRPKGKTSEGLEWLRKWRVLSGNVSV
jgi:hydroxypyruvate isomerase